MRFKHPFQVVKNLGTIMAGVGLLGVFLNIYLVESIILIFAGIFVIFLYLGSTKKEFELYQQGYYTRTGELSAEYEQGFGTPMGTANPPPIQNKGGPSLFERILGLFKQSPKSQKGQRQMGSQIRPSRGHRKRRGHPHHKRRRRR